MAKIIIDEADIVEIVGGPFKGERGKIQRIDKAKDEVTVELLEASVPIPVTIATEFVKLVKKAKGKKVAEEEKPVEEKKEEVGLPEAEEIRRALIEEKPEEAKLEVPEEEKPTEGLPEKEEKPERVEEKKAIAKPEEPVIMESEEELEKPVIHREKEEEKPEEEDSLIAELEKKKKKKKVPEDLEEGE